ACTRICFETQARWQARELGLRLQRLHSAAERPQARAGWFAAPFFLNGLGALRGGRDSQRTASSGRLRRFCEAEFSDSWTGSASAGAAEAPVGRPAATCSSWLVSVAPEAGAQNRRAPTNLGRLPPVRSGAGQPDRGCQHSVAVGLDSRHYLRSLSALETLLSTGRAWANRLRGRRVVFAPGKTGVGVMNSNRLLNPADVPELGWPHCYRDDFVRHSSVHGALTLAEYEACLLRLVSATGRLCTAACIRQAISSQEAAEPLNWSVVSELADQCVLKHSLDSVNVDSSLSAPDSVACLERLLMMPANFGFEGFENPSYSLQI
uniref:DUF4461 domain-containing protein n=1 Tax=Macrostomum lignano TaxID=282301 RepID=A0A1I8FF91_9PLAT